MSEERLPPERAVRLLRAKAGELEAQVLHFHGPDQSHFPPTPMQLQDRLIGLTADIALVATLLADHIERTIR